MSRYDLAVFDFDGTLADSADWFFGSLNEVAERFGFRTTTEDERGRCVTSTIKTANHPLLGPRQAHRCPA